MGNQTIIMRNSSKILFHLGKVKDLRKALQIDAKYDDKMDIARSSMFKNVITNI